jgi:hypothetical protein
MTAGSLIAPAFVPLMQPVLRRGRSYLDRALLPGDENEQRLNALLAAAADRDLDGVVVFGAAHLPEDLVYYANYVPTTFHGALVARAGRPPVLFAGKGGARDHPYIRTVSWVADIRFAAELGSAIVDVAESWDVSWQRLGTVGLDTTLPHLVRDEVAAALSTRSQPVDPLAVTQRRAKSAREIAVLGRANEMARRAAAAAVTAYDNGAGCRTALAAADFAARAGDAHDCRITAAGDRGLVSLSEVTDAVGDLTAIVAVEHLGYWGVAPIRLGTPSPSSVDLDVRVARLRSGVDTDDVLAGADGLLVNGIGCAPVEAPFAGTDSVLRTDDVVTVVSVGTPGRPALDVRTVVIGETGARALS